MAGRLDNWQSNLSSLIEKHKDTPFAFGRFDCSLFAGMAVEAVTGREHYKAYVGRYQTAKGALKMLRKVDEVATPLDAMKKHLGEEQPIAFARKGDIVFVSPESEALSMPAEFACFGPTIGICYGQLSLFPGKEGLISTDTLLLDGCLWVS